MKMDIKVTEISDHNVKVEDKSHKYADNSRHRNGRHEDHKGHRFRYGGGDRSRKCDRSKSRDQFGRDRGNSSVRSERSRYGKGDRYRYEKSDKYRYRHVKFEEKYDLFQNSSNDSSSDSSLSKYRTNGSKTENQIECWDRDSLICRRDNNEMVVNARFSPFNDRSNTVFNNVDTKGHSNTAKLSDVRSTELKASELNRNNLKHFACCFGSEDSTEEIEVRSKQGTQMKITEKAKCNRNKSSTMSELPVSVLRKVSLASTIPKTELKYKLGLSKRETRSKECTSPLASFKEDSAMCFVKTFIDTSKSTPIYPDTSIKPKCSSSIDDDIIDKVVTQMIDVKNDVVSLKPNGVTSIIVQQTSATTKMIEESEKKVALEVADVAVTNNTKSLNGVAYSNNLQVIRPTDPRLKVIDRRVQGQRNSFQLCSKIPPFISNHPSVMQSKPENLYPKQGPTPNIDKQVAVPRGQQHPYPRNMTSQYTMPSHPNTSIGISTPARYPCLSNYAGHNRNPPTPMTYGEYKRSKGSTYTSSISEKFKNKIAMNISSTDISKSRLNNIYRSGTISRTRKEIPDAAKSHSSDAIDSDRGDSSIYPPSTEKQNDFVTSSTSFITDNQSSALNEEMETALKQLMNPNTLLGLLNVCGQVLDDNMMNRLKDIIQNSIEGSQTASIDANQPASIEKYTQNPSSEVLKTVASKTPRKNELDKLHEDIRLSFICDEVSSATGRRTCTMSNNVKKESVNQSINGIIAVNKRVVPSNGGRNVSRRKSLSYFRDLPDRFTQLSREQKIEKSPGTTIQEPKTIKKTNKRTKETVKPTKSLKLIGDTNELPAKQITRACSVFLEKLHPLASDENLIPKKDGRVKRQINDMQMVQAERKKRLSLQTVAVKNNNPDWHCLNKRMDCQLCEKSVGNSLISHYVNCHPNNEVFPSRVSPDVADFLRNSKEVHKVERILPEPYICNEFKQHCYFCNETRSLTKEIWLNHTSVHTGYYQYKCNECKRKFAAPTPSHACNTTKNKIEKKTLPQFTQIDVFGYLCDLCNFVRFEKCEIKKHLRCEHEVNVTTKFKKFIFLSFPRKENEIQSNVYKQMETKSRKRSKSVVGLDNNDQELHLSKKVVRSHIVQSEPFIAESNEDDGLFDRDRATSKEKTSSEITYVREDDCTPREDIFESDADWESYSSDNSQQSIQHSISSQDHSPQLDSLDKSTEAKLQSEDKLLVNEKHAELDQTVGTFVIKCEVMPGDNLPHMKAETVAKAKQLKIQGSTKILTQLTTTVTKTDISSVNNSNTAGLPAQRKGDSRAVLLKDWLKIPTLKLPNYCKAMMRDISMFALYKCMAIACAFSTNDTERMLIHLRNHENYAVYEINNQLDKGSPSWLECSYCNKIGDSCLLLLKHIQDEHQSSIFQCPYCFYRSITDYNVIVHLNQFHQFEQKSVLVCHGKPKEYAMEKAFIEKSRQEFVRPLRCTEDCKEITFVMDYFVQHMKSSPVHSDKFKCQVCGFHTAISSAAKHLLCHRIGVLECVYCQYGTNDVESISNHMCNNHPSKFPYICVRLRKSKALTDEQLRSVESTLGVHLGRLVDPNLFQLCPYTEQQLNFLSPSIEFDSFLSQSEAPVPFNDLSSSRFSPNDITNVTFTNAETLELSTSCLMPSSILSYEDFEREYVSDDYDTFFASQS